MNKSLPGAYSEERESLKGRLSADNNKPNNLLFFGGADIFQCKCEVRNVFFSGKATQESQSLPRSHPTCPRAGPQALQQVKVS